MDKVDTAVAVFANHESAEAAVKKLTAAGFAMKDLSLIGKGYHSEEKVVGFKISATGSNSGANGVRSGVVSGVCFWADYSFPFPSLATWSYSDTWPP